MKKSLSLIEKLILFAIFISIFKDVIVINIGIIDFKLPQIVWSTIFLLMLIQKSEKKCVSPTIISEDKNNNLIFAIYICIIAISFLFSINFQRSLKEFIQYIYLFIAMYVVYKQAKGKDFFNATINILIISNAVIMLVAFISIIIGKSVIPSIDITTGGIFFNYNLYSTQSLVESGSMIQRINILGMGPIGISYYVLIQSLLINYKIRVTTGKTRVCMILLFLSNCVMIILGYSRVGILLFFALHIFTLFSKKNQLKNLGIIFATIIGAYIFISLFPNVYQRVLETFNTEEQSSRYHFVFWLIALKTGYSNILTGIGIGNMQYTPGDNNALFDSFGLWRTNAVPTHNFILQIWSEQGIVGLLINMILIALPLIYYINARFIRKTIPYKSIFNYIVLAYIGALIYSLTNNSYHIEIFWEYLGLMYAMKYYITSDGILFRGKYIPEWRLLKLKKIT